MAAFREAYGNLHEMRSLSPEVKIIALTATATASTRKTIMDILLMKNPYTISESPFKTNITYSVQYMSSDKTIEYYFKWLRDDLVTQQRFSSNNYLLSDYKTMWSNIFNVKVNAGRHDLC